MREKLEDLKTLVKNDRRIWAGAGVAFVMLMIWMLTTEQKMRGRALTPAELMAERTRQEQSGRPVDDQQKHIDALILAFQGDVNKVQDALVRIEQENKRIANELSIRDNKAAGIFDGILDKVENLQREVETLRTQQTTADTTSGAGGPIDASITTDQPDELETIAGADTDVPPPPPPPAKPVKLTVISAGDSVPVELLTGVAAPVDGTPYPVVFKLGGPISGPDGSSLDLGESRLIAAAQGSETDARVIYRLTDLAIRHHDGRRSVVKVDGWVVGEDGVRGMKGKLIDKLGRLIVATAGVSFFAALGERFDDESQNLEISDDVDLDDSDITFAGTSAFTDATNRLSQVLIDRYEKLVPVVEVLSGRKVAAIFSQSAEVTIYDEEAEDVGLFSASLD
jgi:hypothetical protein